MTNLEFPRSSQCFVEKGSLHRSYSTNPHAFLRFEISAPNGPHKAVVVVGRTVKIPSPADLPSILFTSSSKFRASPQSILPAVDEITAATMGTVRGDQLMDNHNCHLVSSLTFPERAPSADELSTLLAVISKYRDTHHFSDAHFTWYTRTAFEALVELFEGSEHLEDGKRDGGKICGSNRPLCGNVHEVCCVYKEKREALLKSPERLRKIIVDSIMPVNPQRHQEESESSRQEAETSRQDLRTGECDPQQGPLAFQASQSELQHEHLLAIQALESERQQVLLAKRAVDSELQQILLANQAAKRENEQLRNELQLLRDRLVTLNGLRNEEG